MKKILITAVHDVVSERVRGSDIAPTVLNVTGLACPEEMDGQTLIVE